MSVVEELDDADGVLVDGYGLGVDSQQLEKTETSSLLHTWSGLSDEGGEKKIFLYAVNGTKVTKSEKKERERTY